MGTHRENLVSPTRQRRSGTQKIPVSLIHHCTGLLWGQASSCLVPETQSYAWHTRGVGLPWVFAGKVCVWNWKWPRAASVLASGTQRNHLVSLARDCASVFSIAVKKDHNQKQCEEERIVSYCSSLREVRTGTQGRKPQAGTEAAIMEECCSLTCSPWFFCLFSYTSHGPLPTGGQINQSIKCSQSLGSRTLWMGVFSQLRFLLSR